LEYLMTHAVIPYLRDRFGLSEIIKTRVLKTAAIGESAVDELIGDLMKGSNPTVGLNAHAGQTDVRITAKASTQEEADRVIADMEAQLRERLGDNTYGVGTQTLEEVVLGMLAERDETLAVVETVTLGLLTQRIASAPGRRAFRGGLVVTRREDLAECMSGLELPPEDWVTCPEALDIADHLRKQTGATYALAVLGDTPAEGNTPRTAIALSGPQGSVQCDVLQRSARDAYGRTWLSTMALNMLRKQILNH
jgi:nicotinamide-nucleotide amidase